MEYITHVGSDGRKLGQPPNKTGSRTQNSVRNMYDFYHREEQNYWETLIDRRSKDPKRLWTTFNGLLDRRSRARCEQTSTPFTADVFLEKITAKVSSILDATATAPPLLICHRPSSLREVTSAELGMFILAAAPKTCELDPMPTFLVQDYVDVLLPFLTMMCNC